MNIKIAVIDVGIFDEFDNSNNIKHFYLDKDKLLTGYKKPLSNHGTFCFKEIVRQNVDFDILDINVSDHLGQPQLAGIILGIEKAIEERADIINISLGLSICSDKLYKTCQKAVDHNIAIISAASHSGEVSYPADFKNVCSVKVSTDSKEIIKTVDESTISIYRADDFVEYKGNITTSSSTSMVAAYFSGLLGKNLESNPVYDKFTILQKLYGICLDNSKNLIQKNEYKQCDIYSKLQNKKVAIVLLPYKNFKDINSKIMLPNIIAFYDHDRKNFYRVDNLDQLENNFDTLMIINTKKSKSKISPNIFRKFEDKEIICIGEFENNIPSNGLIYRHGDFFSETLSTLSKPVILISGLNSNLNKFDIQVNLFKNLKKDEINPRALTYNPEGLLYGFDIFNYDEKVTFPDIVCSINNYMSCAETQMDLDVWIINVAGGCFFINNQNKNIFGKLVTAYFDACNVDIFILCVNNSIDIDTLKIYFMKLKNMGVKEIILVLSENAFDISSLEKVDGIQSYKMDSNVYLDYLNLLKQNFEEKIFTLDDVKNNSLYNYIIEKLTS